MTRRPFASWPLERFVGLGILAVALILTLLLGVLARQGLRSLTGSGKLISVGW